VPPIDALFEAATDIYQYSMYGHIDKLADEVKKGIEEAGGQADRFQ